LATRFLAWRIDHLLNGLPTVVDDLDLPGALPLHVIFGRSQVAHGILRRVDV
jgi:hypothetical protein